LWRICIPSTILAKPTILLTSFLRMLPWAIYGTAPPFSQPLVAPLTRSIIHQPILIIKT
jgi:hypothetical protein